jgi:hypothetical protein
MLNVLHRFVLIISQFIWDFLFLIRKDSSQYGEQQLLHTHLPTTIPLLYLEIGAHQPIKCSNTWNLYQNGWRGICVDPQRLFALNWKFFRPKDEFLPVAISVEESRFATFYDFERKVNLVSTMDPEFASVWSEKGYSFATKQVPALSPEEIVERYVKTFGREPHLLLLDVEGLDYALLQRFLRILEITQWILYEDHKKIALNSFTENWVELGRAGPSVLISRK